MAVAAPPKPNLTHRGGSWKIDWDDAFAWYAADPTRTAGHVAERFHVSERGVRNHMKTERWPERRRAMLEAARQNTDAKVLRSLEERRERTIRVAEKARDAVLAEGVDLDADVALRTLPRYAQLEELYEGHSTGRVQVDHAVMVAHVIPQAIPELVLSLFEHIPLANREAAKGSVDLWAARYREQLALPAAEQDGNSTDEMEVA